MDAIRCSIQLIACAAVLTGCVTTPSIERGRYTPHSLTREEARRVEIDVLRGIRASDALFSSMKAAKSASGSFVVCGWVRVRSPMAEYASYPDNRPFAVSYARGPASFQGFRLVHFADVKRKAPPLYAFCSERGIAM